MQNITKQNRTNQETVTTGITAQRVTALGVVVLIFLMVGPAFGLNVLPGVDHQQSTAIAQTEPAKLVVEPIYLDCRSRTTATVPLLGKKEHKLLGQVYRTDTVQMVAVGDIDTCVEGKPTITGNVVEIAASQIRWERPRVNAELTRNSIKESKGFLGRFTDVFPWVDTSSGLTPAGYEFAQKVIGSSACMEAAWETTAKHIRQAYEDEYGSEVEVIIGEMQFEGPRVIAVGDFQFSSGNIRCEEVPR